MKKYKFTSERHPENTKLRRIVALRDFGAVKKGDLGGWIEKHANLSHEGFCWVSGNALVSGDARVSDNALVYSNARVSGNALVYGDARVSGNALVSGNARASDNALVSGDK